MSLIKSIECSNESIESSHFEPLQEQEQETRGISDLPLSEAKRMFVRCIKNEKVSTLKRLLKHRDDIDVNMNNGWALLYSIENECIDIFKVLIAQGGINLNIQSGKPLLTAVDYSQYKMFKMLIDAGANINLCCYRLMEVVKESGDSRFKYHLTKRGFTLFHSHIPSYINK